MNKNNNGQKTKTSGKDGTMRKRFTILELLIVVSVIAILAGMMLPALNKAKQTAGKLSCVNNLKSIGAAQAMYSGGLCGLDCSHARKFASLRRMVLPTDGREGDQRQPGYAGSSALWCPVFHVFRQAGEAVDFPLSGGEVRHRAI